jgi:hypothetical protein
MPLLDESRKRFLAKFFVVGACAPAVWVSAIYALRDLPVSSGLSEVFGWVLYSVYFVTFPTQVIFLDAEHFAGNTLFFGNRGTHERCLVCVCSDSFLAFT